MASLTRDLFKKTKIAKIFYQLISICICLFGRIHNYIYRNYGSKVKNLQEQKALGSAPTEVCGDNAPMLFS